jgi:hypothetical protein
MAFLQIVKTKGDRARIKDVPIPQNIRASEEERAAALLREKADNRGGFHALSRKQGMEHAPHPKRPAERRRSPFVPTAEAAEEPGEPTSEEDTDG